MSSFRRLFFWLFFLIIIVLVGLYVFVSSRGQQIAESRLSAVFGRPVSVSGARIYFPFGVRLDDLKVGDALTAKSVRIEISLPYLLSRHFWVSRVTLEQPVFYFGRALSGDIYWGKETPAPAGAARGKGQTLAGRTKLHRLDIDFIRVRDGTVFFADHVSSGVRHLEAENIVLKASGISYPPRDREQKYEFSARMVGKDLPFSGGLVESRGWANFVARDMDASFSFTGPSNGLSLSARLKSVKNKMAVTGTIRVDKIPGGSSGGGALTVENNFGSSILALMKTAGLKADLQFAFETAMDHFQMDNVNVKGQLEYDQAQADQPGLAGDLERISRQLGAIGKKLLPAGNGAGTEGEKITAPPGNTLLQPPSSPALK